MTENKNGLQIIDKMTRNRVFISKYWKEHCFALNAETFLDRAIQIKSIGGLYGGVKKPTKFLCLVFKLLQMNLSIQMAMQYLKARDYKYLIAMTLFYLRLVLKGAEVYKVLQPFYNDNRKLIIRNTIGLYDLTYIDQMVHSLLTEEVFMGISLPTLPKRINLEDQGLLEPRVSILHQQLQQNIKSEVK